MTLEEFKALSREEQDKFIASDGIISPCSPSLVVREGSELEKKEPVNGEFLGDSPRESVGEVLSLPPTTEQAPPSFHLDSDKDGFDITDPVELLFLIDDDVQKGKPNGGIDLHGWQVRFMLDFADSRHTKDFPFQAEVCAANGSGKDKYIVAACAVWLGMRYRKSLSVCTNGSGEQLDTQTLYHINNLCTKANSKFPGIWKCNYRYFECLETQSIINLFATDEPNKAEGHHPLEAGAKFAIFASEAKAIPDDIFTALERCHGFTHKVDVSSPGPTNGHFHEMYSTSVERKSIETVKDVGPTDSVFYHITAYDCPHISENEINRMIKNTPGGINSPVVKSSIFAEFGSNEDMIVIPYTYIYQAIEGNTERPRVWIKEEYNKGGLDLSDGGDETVLTVRNGNKLLQVIPFKFDNTQDTIDFLIEKFNEHNLNCPEAIINADCGGLGKPMIDQMHRMGWTNIRYIDNRNKSYLPKTYNNRGTELWFHVRRLFERRELIIFREKELIRQLSNRYYKILNNVHQLLSKVETRTKKHPSPDRADAFVLCFWDYKSTRDFYKEDGVEEKKRPFELKVKDEQPKRLFSLREWAKTSDPKRKFHINNGQKDWSLVREELDELNKYNAQQRKN